MVILGVQRLYALQIVQSTCPLLEDKGIALLTFIY